MSAQTAIPARKLRPPSDLQLEADATARFLPWALAVMVFLAVLALAGALALDDAVQGWRQGVSTRLTVQIADRPGQPMAARVNEALGVLRTVPGVKNAAALSRAGVEALLKPWLGASALEADLPLPGVIDVELESGAALSVPALAARLEAAVPGAKIDDPKPGLDRLVRLARLLQGLGAGIVAMVGLAAAAIVVFATRASLATRRGTIEVLHLIGAEDRYIARQFQRHLARLALIGGGAGCAAALLFLLGMQLLAGDVGSGLLPALALAWWHWPVLLLLPLAAGLLALVTARVTVFGDLKAML